MLYNVTVDLSPAPDAHPLDELQAEGAASLLDSWLDEVEGLDDEDDEAPVELVHYRVVAHPEGALLSLVVAANSLGAAESACRELVETACEDISPLSSWHVAKAEVQLDTGEAEERLADADSWELDDAELVEAEREDDYEGMTHERVMASSTNLRGFDTEFFGVEDDPAAERYGAALLCMGAVSLASEIVIDELFADIADLAEVEGATAADIDTRLLEGLPPKNAHLYDKLFAQRFLVSAVAVADRMAGRWEPCANVAEELALRLILLHAEVVLDLVENPNDSGLDDMLKGFAETVFEDFDTDFLYDPRMDGVTPEDLPPGFAMAPMDFGSWFVPFNSTRTVNPYCLPDEQDSRE